MTLEGASYSAGPNGIYEEGSGDDLQIGDGPWVLRLLEHSNEVSIALFVLSVAALGLGCLRCFSRRRWVRVARAGAILALSLVAFAASRFFLADLVGDEGIHDLSELSWSGSAGVPLSIGAATFVFLYAASASSPVDPIQPLELLEGVSKRCHTPDRK